MDKYKVKHIGWFFGFLKNCVRDLFESPIDCVNEIGLFKENWQDFKTRIYFDTDPEAKEVLDKLQKALKDKK